MSVAPPPAPGRPPPAPRYTALTLCVRACAAPRRFANDALPSVKVAANLFKSICYENKARSAPLN